LKEQKIREMEENEREGNGRKKTERNTRNNVVKRWKEDKRKKWTK
jgi:hypothetical protein